MTISQHFTGLCIDIHRADGAHAAQAGQCDMQRHAPHYTLPADDQFWLGGGARCR